MKVLALLLMNILALVAAEPPVKAPYLPSGWRPQGPSFELPTEVQRIVEEPEPVNLEVEAEGSDAFREYGPPKVDSEDILQDITVQNLPSEEAAQAFITTEQKVENTEGRHYTAEHEIEAEDDTIVVQAEEQRGQIGAVVTQQEEISTIQKAEQVLSQSVQSNFEKFEQTVVNLENQVSGQAQASLSTGAVENQVSSQAQASLSTGAVENQVSSQAQVSAIAGSAGVSQDAIVEELKTLSAADTEDAVSPHQGPLGFLEYGPPNFQEYGPPKRARVSEGAATESVITETTTRTLSDEVSNIPSGTEPTVANGFPELLYSTSEVRRRRFSPRIVRNTHPGLYAFNNLGQLVRLQ